MRKYAEKYFYYSNLNFSSVVLPFFFKHDTILKRIWSQRWENNSFSKSIPVSVVIPGL